MRTKKQLLPIDNRPAIVRCVESILNSGVADIVVVVNPEGNEIVRSLSEFPVAIAVNYSLESDMAESVRVGLKVIGSFSTGVFICLSDHPLVASATLQAMGREHQARPDAIIIPMFHGRRGHPTLFPCHILAELKKYSTLRDVISSDKDRIFFFDVADEGVVMDMDTPEEYQKILERC
ncbi:MAG TPA: nucleotidyltransferase family protein [Syntrophales bacterium]|nr:nucleotidyltransferase family protein [Syntrophales bacterium]